MRRRATNPRDAHAALELQQRRDRLPRVPGATPEALPAPLESSRTP